MTEPTILSVTADALEMIIELRDQEEGDGEFGLLIEVTGFRGAEFQYELSFTPVADADTDTVVERHGDLALMLRNDDIEKLRGSSLNLTDRGLAMNNPNTPATPAMEAPKGDLTGPLADRVQQVLREQVNPAIAGHGGAAELVSVDEGYAYLRLMGGCQGCGMAAMTLSTGIERILTQAIPELVGVVDVTDHASGTDPYYQQAKK